MKKIVLNFYKETAMVSNARDAVEFINSLNGITANESTIKNLDDFFAGTNSYPLNEIATTGCGASRIMVYNAQADTLEKHNELVEQRKIQNKIDSEEKANVDFQQFMNDAHELNKGWYEVTIKYAKNDYKRGGHNWAHLNGRVIADSVSDAYKKGCEQIEEKNGFWADDIQNALITYVGVLTDEYLLNE